MNDRIAALEKQIEDLKVELSRARRDAPPQAVAACTLTTPAGEPIRLSALFGNKPDLLVVHNMGRGCAYCTMWADGFNGVHRHLDDRAAFVLCSPDEPRVLREFAASRGWTFRTVSSFGSRFQADMGFEKAPGKVQPGVSAFRRDERGAITRVGRFGTFGPGDDFCAVWHFLDLLDGGAGPWEPKFAY